MLTIYNAKKGKKQNYEEPSLVIYNEINISFCYAYWHRAVTST